MNIFRKINMTIFYFSNTSYVAFKTLKHRYFIKILKHETEYALCEFFEFIDR